MDNQNQTSKRRVRGTESVRSKRKRLKTHGLPYLTYKNVQVGGRKLPDKNVSCKCKHDCKKLGYDYRLKLFQKFYACDKAAQGTYLLGNIQIGPVARRRHGQYQDPENSRRQSTVYYTIPDENGQHIRICRQIFTNIFALSHKEVQVLVEKKKKGNLVYEDKRGKSTKERKYNEEIRNKIRNHIKSFPLEENHYCRKKSNKQYLSPDLNINRLYLAFKQKYKDTTVTYRYYSDMFHKEFKHLRFGKPRTDTCGTCDLHNNALKSNPADKTSKTKLELHQRKSQSAVDCMKKDIIASQEINSNICTVTMDLEQVLFVPSLTHSQMFYSRQLSVYNLCIHVGNSNASFMCVWDESIGGRGGNAIASCLLKVILDGHLAMYGRKLTIWTDNCIGQNKNKMVLFALIFCVINNMFDEIEQKFLVSGHSYMACDRDFALIEKRKRVTKCFTPECIRTMIKDTKHITPFHVINMEHDHFKNIEEAANRFIYTGKLNISKLSHIKITKDNPTVVKIKKSYSELESFQEVQILKKGKTVKQISEVMLRSTDQSKHRITKEKLINLKDMIPYIPLQHQAFYEALTTSVMEPQTSPNTAGT